MSENTTEPKWRRFEKLVTQMQSTFAPTARVVHNEYILGLSGIKRQVDVAVRQQVGQFKILIAIECKDLKRPVGLRELATFAELVKDIQANKAAIVSASGFRPSVIQEAKKSGIELYRLFDAESADWGAKVKAPIVWHLREMEGYRCSMRCPRLTSADTENPRHLHLFGSDGEEIGTLEDVLWQCWHKGNLPTEPGEHKGLRITNFSAFIKRNSRFFSLDLEIDLRVKQKSYFGHFPLIKIKGLQNIDTGGVLTTGYATDFISTAEIYRNSERITSIDDLSIKPLFEVMAIAGRPERATNG